MTRMCMRARTALPARLSGPSALSLCIQLSSIALLSLLVRTHPGTMSCSEFDGPALSPSEGAGRTLFSLSLSLSLDIRGCHPRAGVNLRSWDVLCPGMPLLVDRWHHASGSCFFASGGLHHHLNTGHRPPPCGIRSWFVSACIISCPDRSALRCGAYRASIGKVIVTL